ncbi:dihydrofolate reductase family protein [Brachybacterium sp. UNK5269]|uniref:dihydrofolate reductase family protein n=1 Tax=Brachybacterium sp. UNK5269 TaxID=3408576 RepID=UPI003BB1BD05
MATTPGRLVIDLFSSLDGVMQAPGGPDEDPEGGFAYGGWQAPFADDGVGAEVGAGIAELDALLLGRRTYDIFAAYWPHHLDGPDSPIARTFDAVPKYVASRGRPELPWRNSHLLGTDLETAVAGLRARHRSIHVIGSIDFSRTLVARRLFDELTLWVYPIVLGAGKRLFPPDGPPRNLALTAPPTASATGTLTLRYAPAPGEVTTGDMSARD